MTGELAELAAVIKAASGVVVGAGQTASLLAALARVDPGLTPADVLSGHDPAQLERLVDEASVKETFFLRHPEELADIDWPSKAARAATGGRPLRVWSAGCSTGEEAYSLAMVATERLGGNPVQLDVLGTDLSAPVLALAERGLYGTRSTRLVGDARRARWFAPDGARLRVGSELRRSVRFARHNLVRDPVPPAGEEGFDLIVCRNVLIYFDTPTAARVAAALRRALTCEGRLLLGAVDRLEAARGIVPAPARQRVAAVKRPPATPPAVSAGNAHTAFETGSRALGLGDAAAAVSALSRALSLDPQSAVVALQLARAHEAGDDVEAAREGYRQALTLIDHAPGPWARRYDLFAAGDIAATCRARLAGLPAHG